MYTKFQLNSAPVTQRAPHPRRVIVRAHTELKIDVVTRTRQEHVTSTRTLHMHVIDHFGKTFHLSIIYVVGKTFHMSIIYVVGKTFHLSIIYVVGKTFHLSIIYVVLRPEVSF
jgi:hypothetical protein